MDHPDDELGALIRQQATRHQADDQLRAAIRTRLLLVSAAQTDTTAADSTRHAPRASGWTISLAGWRNLAISFLLGVALTLLLAPHMPHMPQMKLLGATDEELVADHVRALRVGPLFQVQSSDRHTVKPWFQGKLDYAPPVLDLADAQFPLLGGRVEHFDSNSIAALVYGRHGHMINLFVWPADQPRPLQSSQVKGFNVSHWSDGRMQFWVVSDMDKTELAHFVQALQGKLANS